MTATSIMGQKAEFIPKGGMLLLKGRFHDFNKPILAKFLISIS
jgi:hypothetical protein